jgi:hypothetical protein
LINRLFLNYFTVVEVLTFADGCWEKPAGIEALPVAPLVGVFGSEVST